MNVPATGYPTMLKLSVLSLLIFSAVAGAAPCNSHRLGAPVEVAAWASSVIDVADFDGDRITDAVVRDEGATIVRLLRRGGRHDDFPLAIAGDPRGVVTGDFTGDGRPDLVVTTFEFQTYLVINALPEGFQVSRLPEADNFAAPLAADFNGDSRLDLLMVGGGPPRIFHGDGSGSFPSSLQTSIAGTVPAAVVDWNRDGWPDVVTAASGDRFTVHLNMQGTGFTTGGTVQANGFTNAIVAGDVTGDDHPDLVILTSSGLSVAIGEGNGFAGTSAAALTHTGVDAAIIGDFDGDGRNELAFSLVERFELVEGEMRFFPPELILSEIGPAGGRADAWAFATRRNASLFAGDFDGDGRQDLMAGGAVYRGMGGLGFVTETRIDPGFTPDLVAAGDYDGDGISDLAVAARDGDLVRLYRGRRSGGLEPAGSLVTGQIVSLTARDFDLDGQADLVVATDGEILVHYGIAGDEDSLLGSSVQIPVSGRPLAVTALDLTTGRPGLLFAHASGERFALRVFASDVPRGFFHVQEVDAGEKAPASIALADVDVNSVPDFIISAPGAVPTTPPFEHDGTILALRRDGTGAVVAHQTLFEKGSPVATAGRDWDGDGDDDLVVAQQFGGLFLLRNDGSLNFTQHPLGARATLALLESDLDRDGQPDLILLQAAETILRLEHRDGAFAEDGGFAAGGFPVAIVTGDFDGNGVIDFAIANSGSGSVSVVYGSCGRTRPVRRG